MKERMLTPFLPTAGADDDAIARFNDLTRSAWGMRESPTAGLPHEEWNTYISRLHDAQAYAAEIDSDPVVVAARVRVIRFGRVCEILTLGINPRLRGQGLGTQAVAELVAIAGEHQSKIVKVTALTSARSIYERNGFTATSANSAHTYMHRRLNE